MTEDQIFLAALELPDAVARNAYLHEACGGNAALRQQVEALLASHFKSGEFLDVPAPEQISIEPTVDSGLSHAVTIASEVMPAHQDPSDDSESLEFLAPPTREGSLGRIDHYEVLQVLGKGGFGIVFRAFDDTLQRVVAIKMMAPLLAATSPARKRFLREARTSAQVRHENIVQVYEVGEQPLPYLVMEFIPGETLQQRVDRVGPLDVLETLQISRQIAEGLAAAHAMDLIHRDIKPGNVLLEGGQHKVKITDFGLARTADDASVTQSGQIAGTPMYMAPEQALGHPLDHRVDLFSLGSVMYQMVAGRPPFRANTAVAVLKRVVEDKPRNIREVIPETPQWLCDIIAKLHAKKPEDRYQSAREVADVLADCEQQLKASSRLRDFSRIPRGTSAARGSSRWKWTALTAFVVLFAVIALAQLEFAGVTHLFRGKATTDPIQAGSEPTPIQVTKLGVLESDGWVQLFNGKDLTGWKTQPAALGNWVVNDGILVGSQRQGDLYSERGDFANFHLRVQAKVNLGGDSGVFFRVESDERQGVGYEAEIHKNRTYARKTGTIEAFQPNGPPLILGLVADDSLTKPDEWFDLEIIAQQGHFITKVNGQETANCNVPSNPHAAGRLGLQVWSPNTVVQFRKIEIKELPASSSAPPLAIAPFDTPQAKAHQEAWAKHLGVPVEYTNSIGMKFRLIPPGEFQMGSTPEEIEAAVLEAAEVNNAWKEHIRGEAPRHRVVLKQPFYLGVHEVTQAEYQQMTGWNPSHFGPQGPGKDLVAGVDTTRFPVEMVSWQDAADFCVRLSEQEALPPCYSRDGELTELREGTGYRLPSEAEWEFACRAGTISEYWNGNDVENLMQIGWFGDNSTGRSHNVGELPANPFGLHDMHGNIWEWVQDGWDPSFYASLNEQKSSNPVSPLDVSAARGARGGNWYVPAVHCRAADRGAFDAKAVYGTVGFRAVLSVDAVKAAQQRTPPAMAKQEPLPLAVAPFTDADVQRIAALPAEQQVAAVVASLKERNPGLNGTASHKIVDGVVKELNFNPTDDQNALTDISPVRALAGLTSLNLWNCSALADLGPLQGLPLTRLLIGSLDASNQVRDLKPLQGMRLTELQLYQCQVEDLKPLAGMPLIRLRVFSRQVRDCAPLKGMPLTTLDLSYCSQIQDFTPLTGLPLTGLHLNACQIRDLQPLLGLKLTEVSLAGTRVQDLQQLRGMPLKNLAIHRTGVTDLTPLQGMDLKEIFLTPKNITQGLNHLREMQSLNTIGIGYTSAEKWPAKEFWDRYDKEEFAVTPFTDADVQRIAALPAAEQVEEVRKELMRLNPGFDGKLTPTIENDVVTQLSVNTDQVTNIAPVRALTKLIYLDCRGTYPNKGKLSDLSPLAGTTISRLDCSSTQVSELAALSGLPLTYLHFNHNPVSDISPLKEMALVELGLAETKVSDLSPLKGMKLRVLGAQLLPVTDLSPLAGMPLKGLDLYHTIGVTSLEPLRGMPLEGLNLQDLPVSDLSPLAGMTTLRTLLLQGNEVSDLTPLKGLKLTDLLLLDKQISDLSALNGMPLIRLHIYNTSVSDLTPLQGMPLQEIRLNPKNITQGLDILKGISTLKTIGIDSNQAGPPAEFWERLEKGEFK